MAGLPDGVINVVTGGPSTGAALCAADDIHYIDLTGGTETGRKVASQAGQRLIRSTMELGKFLWKLYQNLIMFYPIYR